MTESLTAWLPLDGMEEELFFETVRWNIGALQATLSRGKRSSRALTIDFGEPLAFRVQPQHAYLTQPWWGELPNASIYTVRHSEYAAELKDQSAGIAHQAVTHYRVITVDGCLDVLASATPVASWNDVSAVSALPPNTSFERTREG
jgi:hypothetical protein